MNIPQMTKIIKIDIISIVSPVSGVESDNGTSSSKSVVVFLLVVEAFGVSESVNSLLVNGVFSSISTKEGVGEGVSKGNGVIVVFGVVVDVAVTIGVTVGVAFIVVVGVADGDVCRFSDGVIDGNNV